MAYDVDGIITSDIIRQVRNIAESYADYLIDLDAYNNVGEDKFRSGCHDYIKNNIVISLDNLKTDDDVRLYEEFIRADNSDTDSACSLAYDYYVDKLKTLEENKKQDQEKKKEESSSGQGSGSPYDTSAKKEISANVKYENVELHELRDTPGFTNYVVSTEKTLTGAVSSAYLKRYYSNIDAEVYFNGNWVEDIQSIQWTINQETLPLFGYNSHLWDDVAQGIRLIQGNFTVLFTKPQPVFDYIDVYGNKTLRSAVTGTTKMTYEQELDSLQKTKISMGQNDNSKYIRNGQHAPVWASRFDIDVVCGEFEESGRYPVHIILKNCYVTNCNTLRSKDGEPTAELYQFIARDFETIE